VKASYDPRVGAGGLPAEVERLEAQAALAWPEERRLLEALGLGGSVLDAGCGSGALTARLAELPLVESVTGLDVDAQLLGLARARVPRGTFVEGAAESLPFGDDEFDGAVARLLLQHVPDPEAVVRELARVVRPGGLVVAIDVDGGLWGLAQPYFAELAEIQAKVWLAQRDRGGDRMIGRRLHRLLRGAGLDEVALRPYAYNSDALGLDAFAPLLRPEAFAPALEDGTISLAEYEALARGYARFRADPDAFVLLVGLLAAGRV
jgi:SAM-dependent methyltransferase